MSQELRLKPRRTRLTIAVEMVWLASGSFGQIAWLK
jgi:hypothetical protein